MVVEAKIAILILAAGESSRMGRPKQLLKWNDSNLLNHSISKALQLIPTHVFIVLGANADLIKSEIESKKVNIVINRNWKKGLGNSISFGVNAISKAFHNIEGILVVLADQPLIKLEHYSKMLKDFMPNRQQIVATEYCDGRLGVPALFDKTYFKELSALNSDFGAKHLINKYSDYVIPVKNEQANADIDTFEQYDKLYAEYHQ